AEPIDRSAEIRCYLRDPDGHLGAVRFRRCRGGSSAPGTAPCARGRARTSGDAADGAPPAAADLLPLVGVTLVRLPVRQRHHTGREQLRLGEPGADLVVTAQVSGVLRVLVRLGESLQLVVLLLRGGVV